MIAERSLNISALMHPEYRDRLICSDNAARQVCRRSRIPELVGSSAMKDKTIRNASSPSACCLRRRDGHSGAVIGRNDAELATVNNIYILVSSVDVSLAQSGHREAEERIRCKLFEVDAVYGDLMISHNMHAEVLNGLRAGCQD